MVKRKKLFTSPKPFLSDQQSNCPQPEISNHELLKDVRFYFSSSVYSLSPQLCDVMLIGTIDWRNAENENIHTLSGVSPSVVYHISKIKAWSADWKRSLQGCKCHREHWGHVVSIVCCCCWFPFFTQRHDSSSSGMNGFQCVLKFKPDLNRYVWC